MCCSIWLILTIISLHSESIFAEIPNCIYEDTVNITGSELQPDGSYLYNNKYVIPANLTGYYEYETVYPNQTQRVERHLRGCICQIAKCIKFCCPRDKKKVKLERTCSDRNETFDHPTHWNVTHDDGTVVWHNLFEDFVPQTHLPCAIGMPVDFELFENSSVSALTDPYVSDSWKTLSKREYCLLPDDDVGDIFAYMCESIDPEDIALNEHVKITYAVMIISQPFLIATIVVYATIPELRNIHGKCLISYLTSLTLTFIMFIIGNGASFGAFNLSNVFCTSLGFLSYYFSIAAFLWLGVISFDLWYNFKGTNSRVSRLTQQKRFRMYFLFVWSMAFICMLLTLWAQFEVENPQIRPGIGEAVCWFDMKNWSAMLYFYGPMLIIITFNTIVFLSTAVKIHRVQKELSRFAIEKTENNRHFNSEKDAYSMYLRLFVVMGLSWFFEVTSYLVGATTQVFLVTDIFNASTGIIIFILFVLKKKVRMLIKKRFKRDRTVSHKMHSRTPLSQRCASTTQMSGESLTHDTDMY